MTVCILIACIERSQAGSDATVVAEAKGSAVVEATVQKIALLNQNSPSLRLDNRFIRRIAWVETDDGMAPLTYSNPDYHGGIWRVDRFIFDITFSMYNLVEYSDVFEAIENTFGINWIQTAWEDCRKPLYSAIAARLYFHKFYPIISPVSHYMLYLMFISTEYSPSVESFVRYIPETN